MIVELADGRKFRLPDDTPQHEVDNFVQKKIAESQQPPVQPESPLPDRTASVEILADVLMNTGAKAHRANQEAKKVAMAAKMAMDKVSLAAADTDGRTAKTQEMLQQIGSLIQGLTDRIEATRAIAEQSAMESRSMAQALMELRGTLESGSASQMEFGRTLAQKMDQGMASQQELTRLLAARSMQPTVSTPSVTPEMIEALRNDLNGGFGSLLDAYTAETRVVTNPETGEPIGSRKVLKSKRKG